jgi:hypothetical protein
MSRVESRPLPLAAEARPEPAGGTSARAARGAAVGLGADHVERAPSSPFCSPVPARDSVPPLLLDLQQRADRLLDLATRGDGAGAGPLRSLAEALRDAVRTIADGLARGASPDRAATLAEGLARLVPGFDAAGSALEKAAAAPGTGAARQAHGVLQTLVELAGRLARWLVPGAALPALLSDLLGRAGKSPAPGGETVPAAGPADRSLQEGLGDFLGGAERATNRAWESGRGVEVRRDPDGTTRGAWENGASRYAETGKTFGDAGFSVDGDFLQPSPTAGTPSSVDQAVGAALAGIGTYQASGSFHHEAAVVHEQGQVSVGSGNARFAAEGEVSVLAASVAGHGSIDVSGGRLAAQGHVEASATLVEASGSIDAQLGPASLQAEGYAYVGAKASADGAVYLDPANGIYAAKVKAKAFAGATAEATARASLGDVASAEVGVGAWAGIGARFELDAGYKDGQFHFKVDIGAALGVGVNLSLGFSINVGKIKEKLAGFFDDLKRVFSGPAPSGPGLAGPGFAWLLPGVAAPVEGPEGLEEAVAGAFARAGSR